MSAGKEALALWCSLLSPHWIFMLASGGAALVAKTMGGDAPSGRTACSFITMVAVVGARLHREGCSVELVLPCLWWSLSISLLYGRIPLVVLSQ